MISDDGFEAHKLINISLGKIAASRSGRTGASLHKSLLVASVLHKARYVYLEEAQQYHHAIFCPPQGQPEEFAPEPPRAPTPLPEVTVTPVESINNNTFVSENSSSYIDNECKSRLGLSEDDSDDDNYSIDNKKCKKVHYQTRKRRRVSDQETEAAVSSILPKKLKSNEINNTSDDDEDSNISNDVFFHNKKYEPNNICSSCELEKHSCSCSDDSSNSEEDEMCNMEVDHITSLVSIFSFNQQQQTDLCSTQAHHQTDSVSPPVLALTA